MVYADAQSAATTTLLSDAGIDYRFIVADKLRVEYVDSDGGVHACTGFRLDRLTEAAEALTVAQ